MSASKIKVGLLGCGRISKFHLDALKADSQYQIVAVADILVDRAQTAGAQYNAKAYSSLEAMLSGKKLDLITLTTPSGLHPAQAKTCADAGVACLSEKPFGCDYAEAESVVEYFEKKNVPLFVVKQNRYNPTVEKVRKWFESGALGKINLIQANVFWQRPQSYYDAESWRGTWKLDGGAFMNQASHYVDLVQWFGGPVERVQSELGTFGRKMECEDTGAAIIRFKSKAIGVISVTMLTYPENLEGSLTLLCEKATIRISGKALNKLEVCKAADPSVVPNDAELNYEPTTIYGNGHGEYYKRLPGFLKEPKHPQAINGREGLKSLKVLSLIYQDWKK